MFSRNYNSVKCSFANDVLYMSDTVRSYHEHRTNNLCRQILRFITSSEILLKKFCRCLINQPRSPQHSAHNKREKKENYGYYVFALKLRHKNDMKVRSKGHLIEIYEMNILIKVQKSQIAHKFKICNVKFSLKVKRITIV